MNTNAIIIFAGVTLGVLGMSVFLNKVINPWLAERSVKKILADVQSGRTPKPRKYDWEITFDSVGLSLASLEAPAKERLSMEWNLIDKVTTFKRDLLTTDLICLFLLRNDGSGLELNEEMKGWLELTEALPNFLPLCKRLEDWIWIVSAPAFATNLTEIYSRKAEQPTSTFVAN